jgi:hypothetical protein
MRWLIIALSRRARARRGAIFRARLTPGPCTRILDLGGGTGEHIASIMPSGMKITVADQDRIALDIAKQRLGFETIHLDDNHEWAQLIGQFDIIFCSSVIEHVTGKKDVVVAENDGRRFRERAVEEQRRFADAVRRIGGRYFVQTPHKFFLLESHTWMPFAIVFLPRRLQVRLIRLLNRFWWKKTQPDWHLLTAADMARLFPDAEIVIERWCGLPKSVIAIKT